MNFYYDKTDLLQVEIKIVATDHALHFFERDTLSVPVLADTNEWEVSIKSIITKINELIHVLIMSLFFEYLY